MKIFFLACLTLVPMAWGFGTVEDQSSSTTICADDSDYVGTQLIEDRSCDDYIDLFTAEGIDLYGCDTTGVKINAFNVTTSPYEIANYLADGCCSSTDSICARDYSGLCSDPSAFDGSAPFGDDAYSFSYSYSYSYSSSTCQETLTYLFDSDLDANSCTNEVNSAGWITRNLIAFSADTCCTDGVSVCDTDFSAFCADPSDYDGTVALGSITCDGYFNVIMGLYNYTFSMMQSCDTSIIDEQAYNYLGYLCCPEEGGWGQGSACVFEV